MRNTKEKPMKLEAEQGKVPEEIKANLSLKFKKKIVEIGKYVEHLL